MIRTIFMIGLLAFVALFALKLFFGILGGLFGILFGLIGLAIPVLIVGCLIYVLMLVFMPDTAREMKAKFDGN